MVVTRLLKLKKCKIGIFKKGFIKLNMRENINLIKNLNTLFPEYE